LISETFLYETCTYFDDGTGADDDGGGGGSPSCPAISGTGYGTGSGLHVLDDGTGETGIGDDGFPPPSDTTTTDGCPVPTVIDSLKNPCFKNVKDIIATNSHASFGSIGQIINISFGFSHKWNLVFKDADVVTVGGQPAEATTGRLGIHQIMLK